MELLVKVLKNTGVYNLTWQNLVMIAIGGLFVWLAVYKKMEPYELLPIGIGIILGNLPLARLMNPPGEIQQSGILGVIFFYALYYHNVLPPLIFLCLGAMTDF